MVYSQGFCCKNELPGIAVSLPDLESIFGHPNIRVWSNNKLRLGDILIFVKALGNSLFA